MSRKLCQPPRPVGNMTEQNNMDNSNEIRQTLPTKHFVPGMRCSGQQ